MLLDLPIRKLAEGLRAHEFTAVDLISECFVNIEKHQSRINAFITILDKDTLLQQAATSDKERTRTSSLLHGIPFVLKDSYVTKGIKTTAASNVLQNYIGQYDATVYKKLKDAGALLIGKMNMDAWGHGASSENTDFGPVKNPWDLSRVAGGSTGGPAAAITSRMCAFAIGEDTGGSIRNPSAWCNTTGLKVTYGRVSRYGCIAYASSFDTVGPMAKTVEDCAIILETIAGIDEHDATSSPNPVPHYTQELQKSVADITIGIPQEFFGEGLDIEIKQHIEQVIVDYRKSGIQIIEVSLPILKYALPVYYLIGTSETSSNLGRYDGVRYGNGRDKFTAETKRRIMLGTYALSAGYYDAYYKKAQQARTLFIQAYQKALAECDVLLMPVTPKYPPKLGEFVSDPIQNMLADLYTTTQNPVGVPSLALPCGFTKNGLPIGMQLVGKMFSEDVLLRLGSYYQNETDWHKRKPPLIKT